MWPIRKLKDLCHIEKGATGIMKAVPGPYPMVGIAEERRTHNSYQFDAAAVIIPLVSSTGHGHASLKRIHYQEGKFALGSILCALVPKDPSELDPLFLYHYLDVFKEKLFVPLMKGMANVTLPMKSIGEVEVPVPTRTQQDEWVQKFEWVNKQQEALTTELTHQRALLKQLRQAILDDAVLGVLDGAEAKDEQAEVLVARIAERKRILISKGLFPNKKRTERYRSTFGSELPKHWTTVELGDVTNIITSGSRGWAEFYSETGPKFIRAQNIRFGELLTTDLACVTPPRKNDGQRTLVERDDLFVVITGAGVSTPARLNDDIGEAYVSQHVALIKPTMPETSEWLLLCLMAPMACRDVLVSRAYGAGKPGLNLDNLRTLVLPFPPLEEQRRILAKVRARLGCLDGLESEVADSELVSSTILQSVLSEVMGGPGVVRYAEAGGKLPLAAEPQVRLGRATKATSQAGEGQ